MDYKVIYSSQTGNTQKVALAIFNALPSRSKDIQTVEEMTSESAETYFVGFWNNRGTCGSDIMDVLATLHGARIALFGTSGMSDDQEYLKQISDRVAAFIPEDSMYLGAFMCGGRMPASVLEKYKMIREKQDSPQIRAMIQGYEHAMLHPNQQDLEHARAFVKHILES